MYRPGPCNYLSNLLVNIVRFVIFMLHRLSNTKSLMLAILRWHELIQLARCKFYSLLHTVMGAILYWYTPVRSKRPVGRQGAFTQRYRNKPREPVQNRFKIRVLRKSEPEIGPVCKRTIRFTYEQKRQFRFRSTFQTCWVSTSTRYSLPVY